MVFKKKPGIKVGCGVLPTKSEKALDHSSCNLVVIPVLFSWNFPAISDFRLRVGWHWMITFIFWKTIFGLTWLQKLYIYYFSWIQKQLALSIVVLHNIENTKRKFSIVCLLNESFEPVFVLTIFLTLKSYPFWSVVALVTKV